jgi:Flp pilus assembly protein TadD
MEDAQSLVVQGRFKEAEADLRESISTRPSDPEAHFLLAYVLLRENRPKESLAEYTHAARLRTPSAEDLRNVALDYVLLNDYPEAEKWTLRSLEMDRNDPETWYSLGRIRYSTGKFQDAVDCFQHTLTLAPRSVKTETNLGLAYEALNQLDQARQSYQAAIDMQKDLPNKSPEPLTNLAILLLHRSELDGALALLKQAVEVAPDFVRAHEQMGLVYQEQNHLADAQAQFERAVALSPQDPRLHFLLGRVYRREGLTQKADAEFARTASLNGTHSSPQQ